MIVIIGMNKKYTITVVIQYHSSFVMFELFSFSPCRQSQFS